MRKTLFTTLLLLLSALAYSQPSAGTFSIIPRLGVSLSNLTKESILIAGSEGAEVKSRYKTGMIAGIDLDYQVLPSVSVSLGAYYSDQGCKYDDYESAVTGSANTYNGYTNLRTNLGYINVPLMLNMYAASNFAVKVGVQLGFNVSGKMEYTEATFVRKDDGSTDYQRPVEHKEDINPATLDFSIPVGLSYEYMNVILDARYNIGLTNVYHGLEGFSSKNSVVTLSAAYRFKL